MRMWMVDPQILCTKHLLGEHGELHKHLWTFEKKHNKKGYIERNCIEPKSMKARHDALSLEMWRRAYKHDSPFEMPDISYLPEEHQNYKIDQRASLKDLLERCPECRNRYNARKLTLLGWAYGRRA